MAGSLVERISLTRNIALYALAFSSMRRGYDISFTQESQKRGFQSLGACSLDFSLVGLFGF